MLDVVRLDDDKTVHEHYETNLCAAAKAVG
jgi:hypothetical protein